MIKSKQISFEVTCAWDCFTTWKVISTMYLHWNVDNKYKYRALHGACY